jgi:hypothetical protein
MGEDGVLLPARKPQSCMVAAAIFALIVICAAVILAVAI